MVNEKNMALTAENQRLSVLGLLPKVYRRIITIDRRYLKDTLPAVFMVRFSRFEILRDLYRIIYCRPAKIFRDPLLNAALSKERKSVQEEKKAADILRFLHEESHFVGLPLKDDVLNDIRDYAMSNLCFGDGSFKNGFLYSEKELVFKKMAKSFVIGSYFNASKDCKALQEIHLDKTILEVVSAFLGHRAIHVGTNLWWSFAGHANDQEQNYFSQKFHFDTDDWAFLKFFWYITDVDEMSGPHIVAAGTHKGKLLRHQAEAGRYSDSHIYKAYKGSKFVSILGKAGTGFVEDTTAYHKGQHPTSKDRLLLCVQFAVNNWNAQSDIRPSSILERIELQQT
jgi:hypothetical protein